MTTHSFSRNRIALTLAALAIVWMPAAASAQIRQVSSSGSDARQTVNFTVGYFALKGLDSRVNDDVLLADLQDAQPLLFEIRDLNSVPIGGEYLLTVNRHIEAGVGLAFSQRTTHTVYANLTHSDNSEIQQDLKLRQVPVSFTGRLLLLPRGSAVEPYIGAGIVAIKWRYSEVGEFVDVDNTIFPARYVADGTATGPTVLAGVRSPIANCIVGGEVRWQKAEGDIPASIGFLGTKIDLGGWTANFTFGVRF
jgi:opacity protein-like surface antigen